MISVKGMTTQLEIEKKFLINFPFLNEKAEKIIYNSKFARLKQWYLPKDHLGRSPRIRSKYQVTSEGPTNTYYFTRKKNLSPGICEEEEKIITYKEFYSLWKKIDRNKFPIEKTRYYLPWKNKTFELDIFHGFHQGLVILEIELTDINEACELPPYLSIKKEVTADKNYSNKSLASKNK